MQRNPIRRHVLQSTLENQPTGYFPMTLQLGKHYPLLVLIFAFAVGLADPKRLIGAENQTLAHPFVGVDVGRKRDVGRNLLRTCLNT